MKISLVAERYAKALFDLSLEKGLVEEVNADSQIIASACESNPELRRLLKSPIINTEKKLTIIREIFEKKVHTITMNYLLIMVRKKREGYLFEITTSFEEIYKRYKNILTVHYKSPVLPDPEIRKQVVELMKKFSKMDIELKEEIDEALIGGFVLSWNDMQYDASMRREIENMRNAIAKVNLFKKIGFLG